MRDPQHFDGLIGPLSVGHQFLKEWILSVRLVTSACKAPNRKKHLESSFFFFEFNQRFFSFVSVREWSTMGSVDLSVFNLRRSAIVTFEISIFFFKIQKKKKNNRTRQKKKKINKIYWFFFHFLLFSHPLPLSIKKKKKRGKNREKKGRVFFFTLLTRLRSLE